MGTTSYILLYFFWRIYNLYSLYAQIAKELKITPILDKLLE